MPSRTGRFLSAVFICFLISIPMASMARGETTAPEDCLSAPSGETPAGSHWRYHIDHVNKRNCWYLRRDGGGQSQAVPRSGTAAAAVSQPPAKPSVVDARAELRPAENATTNNPPTTAISETSFANVSAWNATAAVATRWPDPTAASQPPAVSPVTATATPANDVTASSAGPAQAIIPSIPFSRFAVPIQPETIMTLLAAAIGALACAGAAALISRRSGRRRLRRRVAQSTRGSLWETTDDDRIILSDQPYPDPREYRPRFARGVASATHRGREFARRSPRHASR